MPASEASTPEMSADTANLLRPYVTNLDSNIYCIQHLPPEVIAVLFAYVSRSPALFKDNLAKLIREGDLAVAAGSGDESPFDAASEKARKFHEKWVVGYGHSSVAEHADLKFAIEDVSVIASKVIEDNRLAAYTEKSSRYQVFDATRIVVPEGLSTDLQRRYKAYSERLLDGYMDLFGKMEAHLNATIDRPQGISDRGWASTLKAKALDVARYLLPAGVKTAIGMSCNARIAAHAINKLLSHPLPEMHDIGQQMLEEGTKVCPALLKYVGKQDHLARQFDVAPILEGSPESSPQPLRMACVTTAPETTLAASLLYGLRGDTWESCFEAANGLSDEEKRKLIASSLETMGNFDWPSRAFERVQFRSEFVVDYGAYRDIQRHRMNTQTPQLLTPHLGYDTPEQVGDVGFTAQYDALMSEARELYNAIVAEDPRNGPWRAQYVLPFATRIRVCFDWNLRELSHFVALRSGREGHISYRQAAQRCYLWMQEHHPMLAETMRCDLNEYDLERLEGERKLDKKLGIS